MKNFTFALLLCTSLLGCDQGEVITDTYDCTSVSIDNREHQVEKIASFDGIEIGYFDGVEFVKHSECTAAIVKNTGSASTYLFYEYGNLSEHSGVSSLSFWTNAMGVEMLRAERLNKVGAVVVEDGPVRTVQYMKWVENFGSVVAEDNFDNSGLTRVLVTLGDRSKERYFDPNTQQWDCYYRDNGTILTIDQECTNESSNDIKYLGKEILSEPYFTQLETAVRKYETDSDELDRRIEIYFN